MSPIPRLLKPVLACSMLLSLTNVVDIGAKKQPHDFRKPLVEEARQVDTHMYPDPGQEYIEDIVSQPVHGRPKNFQKGFTTCGNFGPYDFERPADLYRLGHDLADIRLPVLGSPYKTISHLRQLARDTHRAPTFSFTFHWNPRANPNMGLETVVTQRSQDSTFFAMVGRGILDCEGHSDNCVYSLEIFNGGVSSARADPRSWVNLNLLGMCLPLRNQP